MIEGLDVYGDAVATATMPALAQTRRNRARSTKRRPGAFAHQRAPAGFLPRLIDDAAGTVGVSELQGARPEGTFLKPFGEAVIIASSTLGEILFGGLDCGSYGARPCR
jgi:hypothetical protein